MNIKLQDPITKAYVIAQDSSEGGGWTIWLTSINKLFDKVRRDPRSLIGMVFKEETTDQTPRFLRIVSCVFAWVPNPKAKGYPDLKYYGVRTEVIKDVLEATEKMEAHEKVLDNLNEEDKEASS